MANVLRLLANHRTLEQILAAYPYLVAEDFDACLDYAALWVDDEELALSAACPSSRKSRIAARPAFCSHIAPLIL